MMLIINNIMIQSLSQTDSGNGNILYKYCDNLSLFFLEKKTAFGQNGCSEENAVVIMKMIVRWCWDSGEMVETSKAESWYPNVPPVRQVATPQFP